MASAWTQANRLFQVDTPLGPDKFLVRSFQGREAMSELFAFQLELLSEDDRIDPSQIIGAPIKVRAGLADLSERCWIGYISEWAVCPRLERFAVYRAWMVPWLWFLSRSSDCRIFQNKPVPEIIATVFSDHGFRDFRDSTGQHPPLEYCVQYRETACDFVRRLMEREGIFFYFEHGPKKDTLVLADDIAAFPWCPNQAKAFWEPVGGPGLHRDEDVIQNWERQFQYRSGKWSEADFNFEAPGTHLYSTVPTTLRQRSAPLELYDYPGYFRSRGQADQSVRIRMEEEEAAHEMVAGESTCRAFVPGYRFALAGHPRSTENGAYVLVSVDHYAEQTGFVSGEEPETVYRNSFTCIPAGVAFRPARLTPVPVVHGSQTAFVVGPEGEEIYTDQYGRVKVQFHWDRRGDSNEKSSCWIRVAQPLAGKGWGAICLPRIGQEVIVDFLEGDPDRPIITGTVYNAVQMPPYELPTEQTKIALKSNSSKGGGGFNELRFEDKKGHEQVFMHAERDFDLRIKGDRRELVGHDRHLIVRRDRLEQVDRDAHAMIYRDRREYVGRDDHQFVAGKQVIDICESQSLRVDGDVNQQFCANASTVVAGTSYLQATNVVLEALGGLTIKSGANFISINAAGVQISGAQVLINSGGSALAGTAGMLVPSNPPLLAEIADNADPGSEVRCFRHQRLEREARAPGSLAADAAPTYNPNAPENKNKKSWIEIELKDEDGNPVPGERYRITLPDGSITEGTLDEKGLARVDHIDPGECQVTFPNLDEEAWEPR